MQWITTQRLPLLLDNIIRSEWAVKSTSSSISRWDNNVLCARDIFSAVSSTSLLVARCCCCSFPLSTKYAHSQWDRNVLLVAFNNRSKLHLLWMHIWNHLTRVWPLSALLLRRLITLVGIHIYYYILNEGSLSSMSHSLSHRKVNSMDWWSPCSDDHGQRSIESLVKFDNHSNKQQATTKRKDERNFEAAMTTRIKPTQTKPSQAKPNRIKRKENV